MSFFEFQIQENSFRANYKFLLKMAETVGKKKRNGEFVIWAGGRERKLAS